MSRWSLPDRLNLALVALLIFTAWGPLCFTMFAPGNDLIQFYAAGGLVNRGEASRLYDLDYFVRFESEIGDGRNADAPYPTHLYPPVVALLASPWARLPYPAARLIWWAGMAVLFLASGRMIHLWGNLPRTWRTPALLALAGILPVWIALRMGQPTPLWIASLLGGIFLHERGRRLAAGLVFSILAMKPPLAVAIFVWLLLRRDVRSLGGMVLGVAAQTLAVMVFLGPGMPWYYLSEFSALAQAAKAPQFCPAYEHSFGGSLKNVMLNNGWLSVEHSWIGVLVQPLVAVLAAIVLWRAVDARQTIEKRSNALAPGPSPEGRGEGEHAGRYEYACVGLFVVLATPHLLLHDVCLLAVPIVCLWSSPAWRMGVVLYLMATILGSLVYLAAGVSLLPFAAFWVLYRLAWQLRCHATVSPASSSACCRVPSFTRHG